MVYKKQRVRMMGIDTPESRTRNLEEKYYGKLSKAHLQQILSEGNIQLLSHDKGKFGRILGDFYAKTGTAEEGKRLVTEIMIEEGYCVPYFGGSKEELEQMHLANRERLIKEGKVEL